MLLRSLSSPAGSSQGIRKTRDYQQNGKMGSVHFIRIAINPELKPSTSLCDTDADINIPYKNTYTLTHLMYWQIPHSLIFPMVNVVHLWFRKQSFFSLIATSKQQVCFQVERRRKEVWGYLKRQRWKREVIITFMCKTSVSSAPVKWCHWIYSFFSFIN